jgi:hypothetical protein
MKKIVIARSVSDEAIQFLSGMDCVAYARNDAWATDAAQSLFIVTNVT